MVSVPIHLASAFAATVAFLPGDLFVDSTANCGVADGSSAQPFCTIMEAVGSAISGDTIHIAPGHYLEHLVISQDLTLLGTQGDDVTTVDGGGSGGSTVRIIGATAVVMEGLMVKGGRTTHGGGIRTAGSLVLRNSTLAGNQAIGSLATGGGLYANGVNQTITIEHSTIEDNATVTTTSSANGGGVAVRDSTLIVRDSTIRTNSVESDHGSPVLTRGGGVDLLRATLQMHNSTVSGNTALAVGGGIYGRFSSILIENSSISGNTSNQGMGLYAYDSIGGVLLDHVTLVDNETLGGGGATLAALFAPGTQLRNTVVARNGTATYGTLGEGSADIRSNVTSLGNNFIGNSGVANLTLGPNDQVGVHGNRLDPELSLLKDNGGSAWTHEPLTGSPLIDGVSSLPFLPRDQRGFVRPQGSLADIGAVEVGQTFASSCNGDGGDQVGCTACPCANESPQGTLGGCQNRVASAGVLAASGDTSLSQPVGSEIDLRFGLSGVPPLAFCVLTSGAATTPTNPANPCFGQSSGVQSASYDGLRCIAQEIRRHGGRPADASGEVGETNSPWGGEGAPPAGLAHAFGGFSAGQLRFFQAVYREDPLFMCMRGLNTTQAIEVVFVP